MTTIKIGGVEHYGPYVARLTHDPNTGRAHLEVIDPTDEVLLRDGDEFVTFYAGCVVSAIEPTGPVPDPEGEDPAVVSVLTNAIGFEVFHADGRAREVEGENVKINVSDEETGRARSAAVRVLRELRGLGRLS